MIPNIYLYGWESDFLSVSRSGYVYEYEIKLSISDFRADFKKRRRHKALKEGGSEKIYKTYHELKRPNYFYFTVPKDIAFKSERLCPEYAGLVVMRENIVRGTVVKKAPKLHKDKITDKQIKQIMERGLSKYWNTRINFNRERRR